MNTGGKSANDDTTQPLSSIIKDATQSATFNQAIDGIHSEWKSQASLNSKFNAEEIKAALVQAKETHSLVIDWVRSLDFKIGPVLGADGALLAGVLAILGLLRNKQGDVFFSYPHTQLLLVATLVPLIYSLIMGVSVVSPSLKWSRWGKQRHIPDIQKSPLPTTGSNKNNGFPWKLRRASTSKIEPTSVLYFGQIALFDDAAQYMQKAKDTFINDAALLDELLSQIYVNAKIATNKSQHIALSARGLFVSVLMLLLVAASFIMKQ